MAITVSDVKSHIEKMTEARKPTQDLAHDEFNKGVKFVTDYVLEFIDAIRKPEKQWSEFGRNAHGWLSENGYGYDWQREIYYNYKTKKIFSEEFVESTLTGYDALRLLEEYLQDDISAEWKFFFVREVDDRIKHELITKLTEKFANE